MKKLRWLFFTPLPTGEIVYQVVAWTLMLGVPVALDCWVVWTHNR